MDMGKVVSSSEVMALILITSVAGQIVQDLCRSAVRLGFIVNPLDIELNGDKL
jgi:hypothetical protein